MNPRLVATGSKFSRFALKKIDASLNAESIVDAHTVLSLSPTGFSVLVSDAPKHEILLLAQARWENPGQAQAWVANFEEVLHALPVRIDHAKTCQALLQFHKFSLLPEALYSKGSGQDILSYTAQLERGDQIFTDHWDRSETVMAYAVPGLVMDWYHRYFAEGGFRHQATALDNLYQLYPKKALFALLFVTEDRADLFLARDAKVLWYNSFDFQTEEDLLYYLLYTLESNKILPTELELKVAGRVLKGEKLMVLLERYLASVEEIEIPLGFDYSSQITEQELRYHLNLLGAL